jgi:hypothetical protein
MELIHTSRELDLKMNATLEGSKGEIEKLGPKQQKKVQIIIIKNS